MELTSQNVQNILAACMYTDDDLPDHDKELEKFTVVEGIMNKIALDPKRVEEHKEDIRDMLLQLPDTFRQSVGGGWSFLNACMTSEGVQWGEQRDVDALFIVGIAAGLAKYLTPRDTWAAFPGGMPYVTVLDLVEEEADGS